MDPAGAEVLRGMQGRNPGLGFGIGARVQSLSGWVEGNAPRGVSASDPHFPRRELISPSE